MNKKLKIIAIVISFLPMFVIFMSMKTCNPFYGECALLSNLVTYPFSAILVYIFNDFVNFNQTFNQTNYITVLLASSVITGIIWAMVFYYIVRLIEKIFLNHKS